MTNAHRLQTPLIVASIAVLGAFFAFSLFATDASAQGICAAYPDLPQCEKPAEGGGGGDQPDGSAGPTGNLGEGDGSLPFTGYPLNPLILFILALLLAGLALRTYLYVRDRAQASAADART